ncbi:Hypothetical Protein CGB_J1430C [Cryptococcus gattii WM276]|uniref:Uncharacterized protein n=1 Tax=Cryptococcus gattii serotype B (strain WM276 / ATCC MYA-4071) TaxID=367775 RepID=E6RCT0_CRYGW|nr:Hypothetical Protein CGB_J1430C [Cryptococcus gattii WM276]ADV24640.1 Hypothetical Protein CGB_J1430C [Cryptococcus gattii WM276]
MTSLGEESIAAELTRAPQEKEALRAEMPQSISPYAKTAKNQLTFQEWAAGFKDAFLPYGWITMAE